MKLAIPTILFIVVFLLFSIKREYVQTLITLIIALIIDFVIVKGFSTAPLIGTVAISVGKPFITILTYTIIKMIIMGIFYLLIQKNAIIAIIGYVLIGILFNRFYMSMSGNILIDMLCNAIIAWIIFIAYNKINNVDNLKWFTIMAMVINFVLEILVSSIIFI